MEIQCPSEYKLITRRKNTIFKRLKNLSPLISNDNFKIIKIKDGKYPAIVTINGFLTENIDVNKDWQESLTKLYPDNIWFQIKWESKSKTKSFASLFIYGVGGLIHNPWKIALKNAEMVGKSLFDVFYACPKEREYIFFGHSLGARMIYHFLLGNNDPLKKIKIKEVHLLGGAVENDEKMWQQTQEAVKEKIYNYYSVNDDVLKKAYPIGKFKSSPIGLNKINCSNVININVSIYVGGHSKYVKNLHTFIYRSDGFIDL